MQVKVDVLEGLSRKLTIEVPKEEVSKKLNSKLQKIQQTAKLDGFRKGKVPIHIIKSKYEASALQDALSDIMQKSYDEAIREEKLTPAASPKIIPTQGLNGQENFIYEATIEVVPEFEVKGLDSMTINKPVAEVTEDDVNNMIETLRKQAVNFVKTDDAAQDGDRLTVDFVGKIDDKVFDGGSATDAKFIIGVKQMLEEFEKPVLGKNVGDTVEATVNFPEDYHGKEVAGKTAIFEITIKGIEKGELPEVNTDFIKRFGILDGKRETLEKAIRDNMQRELDANIRQTVHNQVMEHLVTSNEVELPESMVEQEKDRMAHEMNLGEQVKDAEKIAELRNSMLDQPARRRVLLGLIMGKLFDANPTQPDPERVKTKIMDIAQTYEKPEEVLSYYQKDQHALQQVYAQVMEDQLIEKLLETAQISEEKKSFDDLMKKNNP